MSEQGQVSTRDTEQLSAYLDGRLERSEAARLEARLSQDPQLRLELQELRATVRVLSSLPQIRPPRSFTLQPRAVGRRTGYPLLQLGTALATLSFLVVVGADLLVSRGAQPTDFADRLFLAPAAQPEAAAEAPALDQSLELVPEATPAAEAAAGAEGVPEDNFLAQAESAVPTGTPQPEALKDQAGEDETAEPGATESAAGVTAAAGDAAEAPSVTEADRDTQLQASGEQVGEAGLEALDVAAPEGESIGEAARRVSPLLRGAEIGLGATALVLGVLTVRARRRQS
jgi:anti-sigma factor RsiW